MSLDELISGIREYVEAKAAWLEVCYLPLADGYHSQESFRYQKAKEWLDDHVLALERLAEAARYWNEARSLVPQPSTPRTWSDDIVALQDLACAKLKLEAENERLKTLLSESYRRLCAIVIFAEDAPPATIARTKNLINLIKGELKDAITT